MKLILCVKFFCQTTVDAAVHGRGRLTLREMDSLCGTALLASDFISSQRRRAARKEEVCRLKPQSEAGFIGAQMHTLISTHVPTYHSLVLTRDTLRCPCVDLGAIESRPRIKWRSNSVMP